MNPATDGSGPPLRIVLSASRRTDIPAFYMPWFAAGIRTGRFEVTNPYNGRISRVPADPEAVHSVVFWSKNYDPFLAGRHGEALRRRGYGLFFNFTLNSPHPLLEPHVPRLSRRLEQLEEICARFGPACIQWRFDPVCHMEGPAAPKDNLGAFRRIADAAAACGVTRCVTSFVDDYAKIRKRLQAHSGVRFRDPPLEEKRRRLVEMAGALDRRGIRLYTCCETEVRDALPPESGVGAAGCIPGALLVSLYGGGISTAPDRGQRTKQGCGCTVSRDIGSYTLHPCRHDCLYCYANPSRP